MAVAAAESEIGTNTSTTTTITCISSSTTAPAKSPETLTTLQTEPNNNNRTNHDCPDKDLIVRTKDTADPPSPPPPPLPKRNEKPKSQHEDDDSAIGIIEPFDDGDDSVGDGGYNTAPGGLFEKIFGEIFSRKNDESHNNCRDSQRSHTKLLHVFNVSTGQSKKHKKSSAASSSAATAASSSLSSHPSKTTTLTSNPFVVKHRLKGLRTSGSGNLFVTLFFYW